MPNTILTPGYNLGLSPRQLKQTLGRQGGQEITAYLPDPSKFTGVAGTEYAQGTAPNLQYVADTIYKQYKDVSGNIFELVPSGFPAGLSDPRTYLKQISGAPQGYAQTPQELLSSFRNFTPLGTGSIFENVAKSPDYSDTTLWQKTPYMGGSQVTYIGPKGGPSDPDKGFTNINAGLSNVQAPANIQQAGSQVITSPSVSSVQAGLNDLMAKIAREGITDASGKVLLPAGAYNPTTGQIN